MMLSLTVLCLAVAGTFASSCSELQALVVKNQWAKSQGYGSGRQGFAIKIFEKLFKSNPETRSVFNDVRGDNIYSPEFTAHALRVFGGMDKAISLLDDQATFNSDMAHLKVQHDERAIDDSYFDMFQGSVMEAVAEEVGLCFNQDAWNSCMGALVAAIK